MNTQILYPLKFTPILKEKIWGGTKLNNVLNKNSTSNHLGESWEISDVENNISIVANGKYKGTSLKSILNTYKERLIGEKNYKVFGDSFPLLIKYIDAKENLSVQLHPNNTLAAKRHNSFGKTEMWYIMEADDKAELIIGFDKEISKKEYLNHLENKTLTTILHSETVKKGDAYFIEVGRVHAIGAGVMLAEIQQTSDITYRVYDWDRVDNQGKRRELHNDLALDAINFKMKNDFKIDYNNNENTSNHLISCPYFTTNLLPINNEEIIKVNNWDSFIIYMCVEGEVEVKVETGTEHLKLGETILIPAELKTFKISAKKGKLLEVYV